VQAAVELTSMPGREADVTARTESKRGFLAGDHGVFIGIQKNSSANKSWRSEKDRGQHKFAELSFWLVVVSEES
jgi:hypothetical protein